MQFFNALCKYITHLVIYKWVHSVTLKNAVSFAPEISVWNQHNYLMFYFHFHVKTSHLWEVQTGVLEQTFLAQTFHQSSGRMGGGAKSYPRATMMTWNWKWKITLIRLFLGFPDSCLQKVIDQLCTTHFLVPNILHYIWLGKGSFDFMYFVSIYSGYKNQHPCLIFLYYDTLPSGEWWNVLLLSVPNIIPVKVNPPSKIKGKKIVFVQHKSDILRLQILTSMY